MAKTAFLLLFFSSLLFGANQCIVCHKGIEDIRDRDSGMMKEILKVAKKAGHEGNDCIVCHGGNPRSKSVKYAHKGTIKYFKENKGPKNYYPSPGSPWINEHTCGMCHPNQVAAQMNSLMMNEQGKIQGAMWSFGAKEGYNHTLGNYNAKNPDNTNDRLGSDIYKKYMQKLSTMEPQVFSKQTQQLPDAPSVEEIHKDPSLAVNTYLRQECLKCHTGSKGDQKSGNFRGLGCASCHIPYSNDGYYEGGDKRTSKKQGHLRTHQIQSSRKVKVHVNDMNYSGVPVNTCSACHNHGKSIGLSYQGLMQNKPVFDDKDSASNVKRYLHMQEDVHYQKGMLCQDCHTSNDLHGDGFLGGTNAAVVEIECQDCHGTTKKFPWELPIGYSDEFNTTQAKGDARGVTQDVAKYLKQGYVAEKEDGYILTSRGNPLVNAVKKDNKVIIHLASGKDIELKPLKLLKNSDELSVKGLLAMDTIETHNSRMECYTCHAPWAPQYYGNHVKIDYSDGKQNTDFLAAAHDSDAHGTTGEMRDLKKYRIEGKVTQDISFVRWEELSLMQNGEGCVSPAVPAHQTIITVIGKDKKTLLEDKIFKIPNVEGTKEDGQNAIGMTPVQPHTVQKKARTCESCHASDKTLGLGIGGQKPDSDYSRFMDENSTQLMTLGHHLKLSGPLSKEQMDKLDRRGVCLSCHKDIPKGSLAVSVMTHISNMAEYKVDAKEHGGILNKLINIGAWFQLVVGVMFTLLVLYGIYLVFLKKEPHNPRNEGWK